MGNFSVEVIDQNNLTLTVVPQEKQVISIDRGQRGPQGEQGQVGPQGENGQCVPIGGNTGQILTKKSDADYDTEWGSAAGSVLSVNGQTGNVTLTYSDVGSPSVSGNNATGTWNINTSGTSGNVSGIVAIDHGGTGASTASNARTNLNAAVLGSNNDITSMSGITGGITTPDYLTFDTGATWSAAMGKLGWDGGTTLNLGMTANVVQKIGEDTFFYIKASSAITKGQLCMFTGTVGTSGVLTAAPATGVTNGQYIIGLAAETLALNDFGLIQSFGTLRGLDTTGSSVGQTWHDGDVLFYNSA